VAIKAGVWIDHTKAVIVLTTDKGEESKRIKSDFKKPARTAKNAYTPNDFVAEDKRERKLADHLNKFYDEVIACIRDAGAILILGPGEAKGELKKRIKSKKLRGRVAELETADKMTDRQIAANIRAHYLAAPVRATKTAPSRKRSGKSG
jgi:hypothetical protein